MGQVLAVVSGKGGTGKTSLCAAVACALANMGLGNSITAMQHAQRACEMEPNNMEYRQLLNRLQNRGQSYQTYSRNYAPPTMSIGRMCLSFWLMNLLFRCFCGFW